MNYNELLAWSKREYQQLPWRKKRSLYGTLVSEIMLQQTTVATVRNKFDSFLKRFPTIESLARASEEEVCIEWKGLGYYRRARLLRQAAIAIVNECDGKFPETREELKKLSGIGDYTASALVAIGMDKPELAIDANIERVIARYYGLGEFKGPKLQKLVRQLFERNEVFPPDISPRDFNESLMDLGRVFCQARRADCQLCPISKDCIANLSGEALAFPREDHAKKKNEKHRATLIRVISIEDNNIQATMRGQNEWLAGQVDLPTFVLDCSDEKFDRYPKWQGKVPKELMRLKSTITKYTFDNIVVTAQLDGYEQWPLDIKAVNFSSVTLKILRSLKLV